MSTTETQPISSGQTRRKRRRLVIVVVMLSVAVGFASVAAFQYWRTRETRRKEAEAVAALRSLGAEMQDQFVDEVIPLGRLFPQGGAAHFRYAIKLQDPAVTDHDLEALDGIDADRIRMLSLLNCKVGDGTLERAGRFRHMTLIGLGAARKKKDKTWPTGPSGLFTDAGFAHLAGLTDLQTVGLHGPDVTDRAIAQLSGARKLRELILYGSKVTGAGLSALGPKPELVTLKLGGTRFGDDDLAALAQFPSIEYLDLRDTLVTDAGLPRLKALPRLKRLSLAGCKVSDPAVDAISGDHPGLAVER